MQADSGSSARAVAEFNQPPGTGYVYALIQLEATYEGAGSGLADEFAISINGVFELKSGVPCVVSPYFGEHVLLTGQSTSGTECIYMLAAKAARGTVRVVVPDLTSGDDGPDAYWATR